MKRKAFFILTFVLLFTTILAHAQFIMEEILQREKIKFLEYENIKNAVGSYLMDEEINAVLARKKLLLAEIEEMIIDLGQDKVIYSIH